MNPTQKIPNNDVVELYRPILTQQTVFRHETYYTEFSIKLD